jgi:hypothetical protein
MKSSSTDLPKVLPVEEMVQLAKRGVAQGEHCSLHRVSLPFIPSRLLAPGPQPHLMLPSLHIEVSGRQVSATMQRECGYILMGKEVSFDSNAPSLSFAHPKALSQPLIRSLNDDTQLTYK